MVWSEFWNGEETLKPGDCADSLVMPGEVAVKLAETDGDDDTPERRRIRDDIRRTAVERVSSNSSNVTSSSPSTVLETEVGLNNVSWANGNGTSSNTTAPEELGNSAEIPHNTADQTGGTSLRHLNESLSENFNATSSSNISGAMDLTNATDRGWVGWVMGGGLFFGVVAVITGWRMRRRRFCHLSDGVALSVRYAKLRDDNDVHLTLP
ncbi:hypothetical protein BV898_16247 [Hypsibius exemplaris]|uniref:Uncharacterized protein n=1 Tax=Hypsibius exemplaris TaxID=2072580 RepID=A0A9X6NCT6_HYPEX|nr:hypothetical protein BV898_16247 [Hypsibius exemplaris]